MPSEKQYGNNNRSTAPTPEFLAELIADQTASCKEAFAAGVKAGEVVLVLTDPQVAAISKSIEQAITAGLEKYFTKLS